MGIDDQIGRKCLADPETRPRASPGAIAADPAGNDNTVARLDIVGGELIGAEFREGVVDIQNQPGVGVASGVIRELVRAGGVGGVEDMPPADSGILPAATGAGDAIVGIGGLRARGEDTVVAKGAPLERLAAYLREGGGGGKEKEKRQGGKCAAELVAISCI